MRSAIFSLALAAALLACDSGDDTQTATASVSAPADTTTGVSGTVTFTQDGDQLQARLALTGVTPGEHGFHVHAVGDCGRGDHDDDGFAEVGGAALGHYDPLGTMDHGAPANPMGSKHAGDLGNVTADANGRVDVTLTTTAMSLDGERPIQGRAVVLHANRDDLETDPGGMSGDRVGCGVISQARDADD